MTELPAVPDNCDTSRHELVVEGTKAILVYKLAGDLLAFARTVCALISPQIITRRFCSTLTVQNERLQVHVD